MTKQEIYQALADGKATSVQRLGSDGMYGGEWRTADSDFMLIDWLASDADWFDEARYRFKPTPVPPGDLTWEEAEAAFKRGEKVEWWFNNESKRWIECDEDFRFSYGKHLAYRLAPAPKMRTIKAEELPAVFWVRQKGCITSSLVRAMQTTMLNTEEGWFSLPSLVVNGATYSTHHTNGPWNKFEVEDK